MKFEFCGCEFDDDLYANVCLKRLQTNYQWVILGDMYKTLLTD